MASAFKEHPALISRLSAGRPAVIEASAGTGKTHTLTHLVADRILRGSSTIDRLLVVTFTEKATAELRQRLRELLEGLATAAGGERGPTTWEIDDDARARVRAALDAFDSAEVFTIHGFCQRALSELAFATGRALSQTVVDGRRALDAAYRRTLRRELRAGGPLRGALEVALAGRSVDDLGHTLAWIHELRGGDAAWAPPHALFEPLRRALAASRAAGEPGKKLERARQLVADALDAPDDRRRAAMLEAARAFPSSTSLAADARLARLAAIAAPLPDDERDAGAHGLRAILSAVEDDLAREKAAAGELDFGDMLTELARALDGPGGEDAVRLVRRKYDAAIVDEFQDTDDVQWSIFRRLFTAPDGPQLVVVGDPKQAIYGFRGADVMTYLEARAELVEVGAPVLPLGETRRSTGPLTDAINTLLTLSAPRPILDGLTPYELPVTCRSGRSPLRRTGADLAPVVIARSTEELDASAARRAVTRFVADEIERLLSRAPEVSDDDGPIRRSDVLVLGYTGQDLVEVGDALAARGVPFATPRDAPLFATYAASATRDVLRALAEPSDGARQRLALATPFFAVPWGELPRYRDAPPSHPVLRALASLSSLAARGRWAEVFAWLADESGLVARARLLDHPDSEIATWLAVLDALAREAAVQPMSPDEMAQLTDALLDGRAQPTGGAQRGVPPLEDAVRLLTVHGSKGLQAKIVFIVGGRHGSTKRLGVTVHDGAVRRSIVGEVGKFTKQKHGHEQDEEDRRLAYVALTRAQQRMYLAYVPSKKALPGKFAVVHERLEDLLDELGDAPSKLFSVVPLDTSAAPSGGRPRPRAEAACAKLDEAWLAAPVEPPSPPRGPRVTSYTAQRHREAAAPRAQAHGVIDDPVPGGAHVGLAVHEVLEKVPLDALAGGLGRSEFVADPEQLERAAAARRRHGAHKLDDEALLSMVHAALTTPIVAGGLSLPPLSTMRVAREVEFAYPWPEGAHLSPVVGAEWPFEIDRGLVRGSIDLLGVHEGRAYVVDWKTDRLPAYDPESLTAHVEAVYTLQAKIYAVGVRRQLALTGGRVALGGVVYVFVRGLGPGRGVYAATPTDAELDAWETSLRERDLG